MNTEVIKNILAYALIFLVIFIVYGRIIFDPNPIVLGESLSFWTTGLAFIKESILTFHQFPLWGSNIGTGFSLIGHPYIQQFYPFVYPFIFFIDDPILATRFFIFFHILFAGIFFFLLMSLLKIPKIAGVFGTIIYINSHFFYLYLISGLFSSIYTLTWLPVLLFFFIRSLQTSSAWFAIVSAFLISILIFAGGLYTVLFSLILLGFFLFTYAIKSILEKVSNEKKIENIFSLLKIVVVFGLFVILFSAIKLLPVLEYREISNREVISLFSAESNLDPTTSVWETIVTLSDFFTPPIDGNEITINTINYIFLFFVGLSIFSKRRLISLSLIFFTTIAFVASLGYRFPIDIYAIFYHLVPGFTSFGSTTRFLVLTWFTLPFLAVLGFEVIINFVKGRVKNIFYFSSIIAIVILLNIIVMNQKERFEQFIFPLYEIPKSATYIKKISEEDTTDFRIFNKWISGQHSGFNYAAIQNGLSMVSPLYVGAVPNYKQLDFSSRENNILNLEKKYKLYSILNTKYIVSAKDDQDPKNQYTKVIKIFEEDKEEGYINEMLHYRSRISFISTGILLVGEDSNDTYNAIKARSIIFLPYYNIYAATIFSGGSSSLEDYNSKDLKRFDAIILYGNKIKNEEKFKKVVEEYEKKGGKIIQGSLFEEKLYRKRRSPNSLFTDSPSFEPNNILKKELKQIFENENTGSKTFEIIKKEEIPGRITVHFNTKEAGFIVLSESFYPGWEAEIDGQDSMLFMADSIVNGVIVNEPGEHTLTFTYKPKSFLIGRIISGGSLIALLVFVGWKLYKRKH